MKTIFRQKKELEEQLEKQDKIIKTLRSSRTELLKENSDMLRENYNLQLQVDTLEARIENLTLELSRNPYNNYEMIVRRTLEYIKSFTPLEKDKIKELV